jgi:hypothetical protein
MLKTHREDSYVFIVFKDRVAILYHFQVILALLVGTFRACILKIHEKVLTIKVKVNAERLAVED